MPINKEPQPKSIPTDSPIESEPLAKIYAQQATRKPAGKIGKIVGLLLSIVISIILLLVILKMLGINLSPINPPAQEAPTPTISDGVIIGPVSQYATHSATRQIEESIKESEEAFRNIRFREDAYLPPSIDLNVTL